MREKSEKGEVTSNKGKSGVLSAAAVIAAAPPPPCWRPPAEWLQLEESDWTIHIQGRHRILDRNYRLWGGGGQSALFLTPDGSLAYVGFLGRGALYDYIPSRSIVCFHKEEYASCEFCDGEDTPPKKNPELHYVELTGEEIGTLFRKLDELITAVHCVGGE